MNSPFLSVIIPAHNEALRLPDTLEKMQQFIRQQPYQVELIVVENASQDPTAQVVREWQARLPELSLISLPEAGKGNAVRVGMLAAHGAYRFMADADLSMPITEINKFLPPNLPDSVVAIGSREVPGSKRIDEPPYRHFTGRVFNTLVRWLALPKIQDSQCGFKCFRADAAARVFPLQTMLGWSFDVEILAIARELGYPVVEIPITWVYRPGSQVKLVSDSWRMAKDLLHIRANIKKGVYRAQML